MEKPEKRIDIGLKLLPGSEMFKPDTLNLLRIDFDYFINIQTERVMCTANCIPDEAFCGKFSGLLKEAVRKMFETGEVMTVTVGERTLSVQRYDGKWRVKKPDGPFQKVLRCVLPLLKKLESQGFTVSMVFQKPVTVIVGGEEEFRFADLVK
jgi:hypothetical protein